MGFLSRVFRPSTAKAVEGEYRPGPYLTSQGWLSESWGWNWWQSGHTPITPGRSAMVQACISAYAQTLAMCPGAHWRTADDGGRKRVLTSALSRILRKPNGYQTASDFLLNMTASLYEDGNAYALALRDDRSEISELHPMQSRLSAAKVAQTGDIFYHLDGNDIVARMVRNAGLASTALEFVPERDVLHIRLETPRHPLKGESPLTSNMLDLATTNAMARHAIAFFDNQSRPSGVLQTDLLLTPDQVKELRDRWNAQSQGLNAGGTPILTAGLKWSQTTTSAKDTQFAEIMKMTDQNIALAFRVPLQILGIGDTPFASTESLMQSWIAMGLGFALNHVEQAFDRLFGLPGVPTEYTELDTSILLRSSHKERIEAWVAGVSGGIYAPNEARVEEGLPRVEFGDLVRVQQQDVPLSFWGQNPPQPPAPPAPPTSPEVNPDDAERQFERLLDSTIRDYGHHVH